MINRKLQIAFYCNDSNHEPVREWLKELPKIDRKVIGEDIKTIELGWPLGMPLVRHLEKGIWEIRSRMSDKKIARLLFFLDKDTLILAHGFIKKTRATPKKELEIVRKRKRDYFSN